MLHLLRGPDLRTHYWEQRWEKKVQLLVGFKPMIPLSQGVHSTAVLRPLPQLLLIIILAILKSQADPTLLIFSFSQLFQLGHVFFVFHLFLFKAGFAAGIKKMFPWRKILRKGGAANFGRMVQNLTSSFSTICSYWDKKKHLKTFLWNSSKSGTCSRVILEIALIEIAVYT